MQIVKNHHIESVEALCILSFIDQLVSCEDCGIYFATQGKVFGVSTFEFICYSKYSAKVLFKYDDRVFFMERYSGIGSQRIIFERIIELIDLSEAVEGSVAARISHERLRGNHIRQELHRIIEYRSKLLDCYYRGRGPEKSITNITAKLNLIEQDARRELLNG